MPQNQNRYRTVPEFLSTYSGNDHAYAIFPRAIEHAADDFVQGFKGASLYAMKSNPHPEVIELLWQSGIHYFDVASLREVEFIKRHYPSARIYLMHPVKSRQLIERAYEEGVRDFVFDCDAELQKILDCTDEAKNLRLYLRLALPKSGGVLPLAGKFGADFETALTLLPKARAVAAKVGLSFHVGSQCLKPQAYEDAIRYARKVVDTLRA